MVRSVHIAATAAAALLVLTGCGGSEEAAPPEPSAAPTSAQATTSVAAAADDEQQIRDLVQAQADAFSEGDWDVLAQLTCAKFRDRAADPGAHLVPPISTFGSAEQTATLEPSQLSEQLAEQFGSGTTPETLDRVAQAVVAYDEAAYQDAMLDLMTEAATLTVDKVENIQITGDTATADVTVTRVMGDDPPESRTDATPFVREDGRWLDCTDTSAPPS